MFLSFQKKAINYNLWDHKYQCTSNGQHANIALSRPIFSSAIVLQDNRLARADDLLEGEELEDRLRIEGTLDQKLEDAMLDSDWQAQH